MKPVAAGTTRRAGGWGNDDVLALRAASNLAVAAEPASIPCSSRSSWSTRAVLMAGS
jgi:hypothetical protein